jgi:hypothetical protein
MGQSRLQGKIKRLGVCPDCISVNGSRDKLGDMEPGLDKFWVIKQRLCDPQILSRWFFWLGRRHALSRMVSTGGTESIGLGARWGCPEGLS